MAECPSHHNKHQKLQEIGTQLDKFDYVRITVGDIHGISRGKLIPARNAVKYLKKGMGVFAGLTTINPRAVELDEIKMAASIRAMQQGGNMVMETVLDTFRPAPWAGRGKYKVAEVLSELRWTDGSPDITCPRYVARKQLSRLEEHGYSILSGIELEFQLFDSKMNPPAGFDGEDFYSNLLLSENMDILCETEKRLKEGGVNLEDLHVEPAPGQFEFNYQPAWGILGGDWPFLIREALKETASEHGMIASFMSKPRPDLQGNGAHFNHSIWNKEGKVNQFWDPSKADKVSDFAKHWMAGLVKHTYGMTAILCPTVNCYRRMHGTWAPSVASWGVDDRFSSYRMKNFGPTSSYVENRVPSGTANPYMIMAVTIAAGLDGVINKLEPPPQRSDKTATKMPSTLEEALQALEADDVLKDALGHDFVEWYCLLKRVGEIKILKNSDMKVNDEKAFEEERNMYAKFM